MSINKIQRQTNSGGVGSFTPNSTLSSLVGLSPTGIPTAQTSQQKRRLFPLATGGQLNQQYYSPYSQGYLSTIGSLTQQTVSPMSSVLTNKSSLIPFSSSLGKHLNSSGSNSNSLGLGTSSFTSQNFTGNHNSLNSLPSPHGNSFNQTLNSSVCVQNCPPQNTQLSRVELQECNQGQEQQQYLNNQLQAQGQQSQSQQTPNFTKLQELQNKLQEIAASPIKMRKGVGITADQKDNFYQGQLLPKTQNPKNQNLRKNNLSKSQRSPLNLSSKEVYNQISQSFQLSSLGLSPYSQSFNLQHNTSQSFNNNSNYQGNNLNEEQVLVKKTQQFIQQISKMNTEHINNMESISDLNVSVVLMMKELSLYQQSQKGTIVDADPTKFSLKRNGIVSCYAAKTHQGLVRNYNEDRVSIILNIVKPPNRLQEEQWPKCSFFGIYDGHGGVSCADFLRDNLHQFVIKDSNFPWNPSEAIKNGFEQAESYFLKQAQISLRGGQIDKSGSCALIILIVGEMCYVANVGDSRAVISSDGGKQIGSLTRDHKPMDELENARIHQNGGKVYQTKIEQISINHQSEEDPQSLVGPYRVLPGRLSVSRTFGDIEAKFVKYGGNPKVVVATPEIKSFKIQDNHDFIVLGCDGIFDKMTSSEVGNIVWEGALNESIRKNVHEFCGKSVENVMRLSAARKSLDNLTVVMIGFDNLDSILFKKEPENSTAQPQSSIKSSDQHSSVPQNQVYNQSQNSDNQNNVHSFLSNSSIPSFLSNMSSKLEKSLHQNLITENKPASSSSSQKQQKQTSSLQILTQGKQTASLLSQNLPPFSLSNRSQQSLLYSSSPHSFLSPSSKTQQAPPFFHPQSVPTHKQSSSSRQTCAEEFIRQTSTMRGGNNSIGNISSPLSEKDSNINVKQKNTIKPKTSLPQNNAARNLFISQKKELQSASTEDFSRQEGKQNQSINSIIEVNDKKINKGQLSSSLSDQKFKQSLKTLMTTK